MSLNPSDAEALKNRFIALLDQNLSEQVYQDFLEKNRVLVPREFVQNHGVHFNVVIRKLSLAKDYTTDFFYMAKSSADWNLILVEIEKPSSKYFKNAGGSLHPDFQAGLDQITRWRAWFDNPSNRSGFIDGTIESIRVPATMRRNPCHVKYVLVHGRRSEFEGSDLRRGIIHAHERDDFKILSYDSLMEDIAWKNDLYLGVRKNNRFEITSTNFVDEQIFSWVEPTSLRINKDLRDDIVRNKNKWICVSTKGGMMLDHVLPKLDLCAN